MTAMWLPSLTASSMSWVTRTMVFVGVASDDDLSLAMRSAAGRRLRCPQPARPFHLPETRRLAMGYVALVSVLVVVEDAPLPGSGGRSSRFSGGAPPRSAGCALTPDVPAHSGGYHCLVCLTFLGGVRVLGRCYWPDRRIPLSCRSPRIHWQSWSEVSSAAFTTEQTRTAAVAMGYRPFRLLISV